MTSLDSKLKKTINLVWFGILFSVFYWCLESVRDVIVFDSENIFNRIFTPDRISFWMRMLVVCILILFSAVAQSHREHIESKKHKISRPVKMSSMIVVAVGFAGLYWVLESVRDAFIYNKGSFIEQVFTPDPLGVWMRLLAVCIISLLGIYAQNLINERQKTEEQLRQSQEKLEKLITERTEKLSKSNYLLKKLKKEMVERNRVEKENEKIQEQLFQVQKMEAIGRLTGGVAHDFNNLITAILGCASLAISNIRPQDIVYDDLKDIEYMATRAADLTRQLLLFSRKLPMQFSTNQLNEIVQQLHKMLRNMIQENIEIHEDLEDHLYTIYADRGTIEQLIVNIMVNAQDAMPAGGKIIIRTENIDFDKSNYHMIPNARVGKFVCLTIEDTGIGMDKETLAHVFDPFFTTKNVGEGTGLGLSVVYGIVEKHKGWIHIKSKPNKGTIFQVYLPTIDVKREKKVADSIPIKRYKGAGERILVIEDEKVVLDFTKRALNQYGYIVFQAENAKKAKRMFIREKGDFNLILSDVILPDKNGLELVEEFLSKKPNLPILMCSGYKSDNSKLHLNKNNSFEFLQKPYSLDLLLSKVRSAMAH